MLRAMPPQGPPAGTSTWKLILSWCVDRPTLISSALLAAGTIAVYSRTFSVPLLFDDKPAIVFNPTIRSWHTALRPTNTMGASGRPIVNLSLAINYAISGTDVWSYHALNLAIHVIASLTLFEIVRRTLKLRKDPAAPSIALSAALLWALHPLQTESVICIIQRTESLMGMFYLLTLFFFIRGTEATDHLQRRWFALSGATCLLGMATKEVMVSAPLMVLLYDRTFTAGSFRAAWRRRRAFYCGLACTWVLLAVLMVYSRKRGGTVGFGLGVSPWAYALTQCQAIVLYLKLAVWPHPLVVDYGAALVRNSLEVWPQALVLILLAALTIDRLWRRPELGFIGVWFFAILAPSSSVVPLATQTIAEHRMYLPLAGLATLAAVGIRAMVRRKDWLVFAALALGFGILTVQRNEDYQSELAIWGDTVVKRPNNERAHNNLGFALAKVPGRVNEAIVQYQEALRLKPDLAEAHNNLGLAWSQMPGRLPEAIVQYREALRLRPDYAEAHNNLGAAWAKISGRSNDAIAQYREALRLQPDFIEAHNNLGVAWSEVPGRQKEAIAQYEEALRLDPNDAEAHSNLAIAWAQTPGRLDAAINQFEEALRLEPDNADTHFNLGIAYSQVPGRLNDAIVQFQKALRLQPSHRAAQQALHAALHQAKAD
jgi:protein O-mannosyl-transferase